MKRAILYALVIMTAILYGLMPGTTYGLPIGGNPVTLGVTVDPPAGKDLHIHQIVDKGIVEFEGFSIAVDEGVYFHQPINGVTLNKVMGSNPSSIMGKLSANGKIFLVNPNGIVFGHTAKVDTAGLIASTLDIEYSDFLDGVYRFTGEGNYVVNFGQIKLNAPGGYVALLGNEVLNTGFIQAELGSIVLASGEAMTLSLDGDGHMLAVIDEATTTNLRDADAAVTNLGSLKAEGGSVLLTANILSDVFDKAINNEGIIEATSMSEANGQIALLANEDIDVGGRLTGGNIKIVSTAGHVNHLAMNEITTAGDNFLGYAFKDYNVGNDTFIDVGEGMIDIYAKQNVYLGSNETQSLTYYEWEYISGDRSYRFTGHGYYTYDQNNGIVYVPITIGPNIGKDGVSPLAGSFIIYEAFDDIELFVSFFEPATSIIRTCHTDPLLNADGRDHVVIDGIRYSWEDMAHLGDHDFNDAIIDFTTEQITTTPGAQLNSLGNIFISADQGEIYQVDGNINTHRLMMRAARGISGTSSNLGVRATTDYLSAWNKYSGGIFIENMSDLTVADLTAIVGLNPGSVGYRGIANMGLSHLYKPVNLIVHGDLNIKEQIVAMGDITLAADGYIHQMDSGNITILQGGDLLNPPSNVHSTSHDIAIWTNNDTFEVEWGLPDQNDEMFYHYMAHAGGEYRMDGVRVVTNGGHASIHAMDDISLALVDADNGNASIISEYGSILDGDYGVVPFDYDVIAHHINLQAPYGTVGTLEEQGEIDLGHPHYDFSYVFDTSSLTIPDLIADPYTTTFTSSGDWIFQTVLPVGYDSDNWNFHIATIDGVEPMQESSMTAMSVDLGRETMMSETVHVGPYFVDMTAPIIMAGTPIGILGSDGIYRSSVSVPFSATDNMSGFPTQGDLSTGMETKTVNGPGRNLYVMSDGIYDRAGNFAEPVRVGPFDILFPDIPQTYENMIDELRVYYEILEPSQFLSVEPAQKIGLYAYHPLTETDMSALDELVLDVNAYEFIEDQIKKKEGRFFEAVE